VESVSNCMPADRQDRILTIISENGSARVSDLSALFGVAEITIRRDMALLEERGLVERTHGGAISSLRLRTEPQYSQKSVQGREEKDAIGAAAAALIEDGETVLVNSGSTTLEVIRRLSGSGIRVVSSNADALRLPPREGVELICTGGEYRRQSNSLIGPFALATLERVIGTTAVIGVDGLSLRYGLTTPNQYEAEIARLMVERTRGRIIVVADHRKIGVVSNFLSVALTEADLLVCDAGLDREYHRNLEENGLKVILAGVD
jgi:DeoR/GlpR family transcriptional regulator of sugar metabolism